MLSRRDLFRRLAGAVVGVSVAPALLRGEPELLPVTVGDFSHYLTPKQIVALDPDFGLCFEWDSADDPLPGNYPSHSWRLARRAHRKRLARLGE